MLSAFRRVGTAHHALALVGSAHPTGRGEPDTNSGPVNQDFAVSHSSPHPSVLDHDDPSIDIYHVAVPLKKKIRHASHERVTSDNLVVRVTLDDGSVGYGEGVPRSYVTGETIETALTTLSHFNTARHHLGRPRDYADVVRRLDELRFPETEADPRGMAGNAARCALEIAILDAYGRRFGQSLGQAIPLVDAPGLVLQRGRAGCGTVGRSPPRRPSVSGRPPG